MGDDATSLGSSLEYCHDGGSGPFTLIGAAEELLTALPATGTKTA
jgi:hypothetical protein